MSDGRSRLPAFAAVLFVGACGPGKAPTVARPAPAASASARDVPAPLRSVSAMSSVDDGASSDPVAIAVGESAVDASGCELPAIASCPDFVARCRGAVASLGAARRPALTACVAQLAAKVTFARGCDAPLAKCRTKERACRASQQEVAACKRRVARACERSEGVEARRLCWDRCTDGFPPNDARFDVYKARSRCGERCGGDPGDAQRECEAAHADCAPAIEADQACWKQDRIECDLPAACWASVERTCGKASTELVACEERARKVE